MKPNSLTLSQRIRLEILWAAAWLTAVMPRWFKYHVVESFLFVVLYYLVRYRRRVVDENLRNSFPEKSAPERAAIRRRFYRTLSEAVIDTVNMAHMSDRKLRRAIFISDLKGHCSDVKGRDWIAMTAHFGCWEYCTYWGLFDRSQILVAVYHPLRSAVMEALYRRLRSHENTMTVAMHDCLRFYLRNRSKGIDGKNLVLGLVADQNPPRRPDSHWFRFLNQDTIFFEGSERLALRCRLPVYFIWMERLGRGRYRLSFEQIFDGEEAVEPHEITRRYVSRLERMIRERPELWMWSHRRWKHKRPDARR